MKKIYIPLIALLISCGTVEEAGTVENNVYDVAENGTVFIGDDAIENVPVAAFTDGDTFKVFIIGWHPIVNPIPVRVRNVNTAETRGGTACEKAEALEASKFTKRWLEESDSIVHLRNIKRGKFFRLIADVYNIYGELLADALIESEHGVPYDGEGREPWC